MSGEDSVKVGESVNLTAVITPSNAPAGTVTWATSDSSIATVSGGTVKGVKAGTVTITASAGGQSGSKTITVSAAAAANSLTADDMKIVAGKTEKAACTAAGAAWRWIPRCICRYTRRSAGATA